MFSKSTRFNPKTVGCGADAAYNPKHVSKPKGGVIPKVDRFYDTKSNGSVKSDSESIKSEKSSLVFRTPKTVKRIPVSSASKKTPGIKITNTPIPASTDSIIKDLLDSKNVEIRNKDETILDYEQQIKELNEVVERIKDELTQIKSGNSDSNTNHTEDLICNCGKLEEDLALVKSHHALALEANENIRQEYRTETESLKYKHDEAIVFYKNEIDSLKKRHSANVEKVTFHFENKIKCIEEEFSAEIKRIKEDSSEKIKIYDIQYEERFQEIISYNESVLKQERQKWLNDIQKCQEFAENEIMKAEIQIVDLKENVCISNGNLNELSNKIISLEQIINSKENQIKYLNSKLETNDNILNKNKLQYKNEIERLVTEKNLIRSEKNKFSLTLETTQKTIEALGNRLRRSDEDLEKLKVDLEEVKNSKKSTENELLQSKNELQNFKSEYNLLLMNIISSKTVLDENHKAILENNSQLQDNLASMEGDFVKDIKSIKSELECDISLFKQQALKQVKELEKRVQYEHNMFLTMKTRCDEAFKTISECQDILFKAECQLEAKAQELNELATENYRLSGTLAAADQEKGELQVLLAEFGILMKEKNKKLRNFDEDLCFHREEIIGLENRICKMSDSLEAANLIVEEKEREICMLREDIKLNSCNGDEVEALHSEILDLNNLNCEIENENALKWAEQESKFMQLKKEFTSLQESVKSKDKQIADLTEKICSLEKSENDKLSSIIQKQASTIDKLKKDIADSYKSKSPHRITTPRGKENVTSPMGKSPKLLNSPVSNDRALTPFRDLNR